jgi:transposase-like protein
MVDHMRRPDQAAGCKPVGLNATVPIEEVARDAFHNTEQYANNRVECDHGRLKARLRPTRGLKTDRTVQVVIGGHAFMQNVRCGHYELGVEADPRLRVQAAFDELTEVI